MANKQKVKRSDRYAYHFVAPYSLETCCKLLTDLQTPPNWNTYGTDLGKRFRVKVYPRYPHTYDFSVTKSFSIYTKKTDDDFTNVQARGILLRLEPNRTQVSFNTYASPEMWMFWAGIGLIILIFTLAMTNPVTILLAIATGLCCWWISYRVWHRPAKDEGNFAYFIQDALHMIELQV